MAKDQLCDKNTLPLSESKCLVPIEGNTVGAIGWITAVVAVAMMWRAARLWLIRRRTRKERDVRDYPRGGEMADLNRLLQEGAISPEEYELLKRRILAGQVY